MQNAYELVRKRHLKRYVEGFYSCRTTIYLVVSCDLGAVIVLVFVLCESGIFSLSLALGEGQCLINFIPTVEDLELPV